MPATRAQLETVMSVSARMIECGCQDLAQELLLAFADEGPETPPPSPFGDGEKVEKTEKKRQADRDRLRQKRHVARLSQGVANVSQAVVADLSHATSDALARASEPPPLPLSGKNSEKKRESQRARADATVANIAQVVAVSQIVSRDNVADATKTQNSDSDTLWLRLFRIWEEVAHKGIPSGSPAYYRVDLEMLAPGLRVRRPKDPEGLFREVLTRYVEKKVELGKKPQLKFFCQDFAGLADYREGNGKPVPNRYVNDAADAQMRRDLGGR